MTTTLRRRRAHGERGIALVITMFLMASLSALAVSLMFLSNTETAATRNYRTMSQARYGGEAAVHAAMNYLMSSAYSTTVPASPFSGYGTDKSPVTCTTGCGHNTTGSCDASTVATAVSTGCVVLSGISGIGSNYPDSAVASAFSTAAQGTLATNSSGVTNNAALGTVNYGGAAILLSMQQVTIYGGATAVLQTWQIVGDGTVPVAGSTGATVEVTASLERAITNAETYAVFASDGGCGAITMSGNEKTDSYDSGAALSAGKPVTTDSGGSVGTNGNLDLSGGVMINGTLTTPRTGVGKCSDGAITSETTPGKATVTEGTINLPQAKTWSDPPAPSPMPATTSLTINSSTTCLQISAYLTGSATCTGAAGTFTITANGSTITLPNVSFSGGGTLTLAGGSSSTVNLNVNTISLAGNSTLALASGTSAVLNVAGQGVSSSGTVLDFTGGSLSTGSYDPSKFQILYAGTANMKMTGGANSSAAVYAPNAQFTMSGNTDFYGSILSARFTDTGGATVHYDRALSSKFQSLGNFVMTSFTWKKY
jgi:Tfp pilus assembly protein PilX